MDPNPLPQLPQDQPPSGFVASITSFSIKILGLISPGESLAVLLWLDLLAPLKV